MNENWIEGIKRNDEMTMLDRYFPGHGVFCEREFSEKLALCQIADQLSRFCGKDEKADSQLIWMGDTGKKTGDIDCYKYEAEKGKNTCSRCRENDQRIYWPQDFGKMPKLPLHPNCKCKYTIVKRQPRITIVRPPAFPEEVLQAVRRNALAYARSKIGWKHNEQLYCNSFVIKAYNNWSNGYVLPRVDRDRNAEYGWLPWGRYALAEEFYYGKVEALTEVFDPQPGDICVDIYSAATVGHGHIAIVSGKGKTISAATTGYVVENDWGFRRPENINARFYRYVGKKENPPTDYLIYPKSKVNYNWIHPEI